MSRLTAWGCSDVQDGITFTDFRSEPGLYPHFFTPKVLRLPAQGCEALGATLGPVGCGCLLPRRGYAHMYGRNPFGVEDAPHRNPG